MAEKDLAKVAEEAQAKQRQAEEQAGKEEKARIDREAGLDKKRGNSYTSPGGMIKIPTKSGGPVKHTPPTPKVPKAGKGKTYKFPKGQ